MLFLSYLLALIAFAILSIIFNAVSLAIYTFIVVKITNQTNAPYHFTNQFIGAFIASLISSLLSLKIFVGFQKEPNIYILFVLYGLFWFLTNSVIKKEFQPNAQRLGTILGLLAFVIIIMNK